MCYDKKIVEHMTDPLHSHNRRLYVHSLDSDVIIAKIVKTLCQKVGGSARVHQWKLHDGYNFPFPSSCFSPQPRHRFLTLVVVSFPVLQRFHVEVFIFSGISPLTWACISGYTVHTGSCTIKVHQRQLL